MTRSSTDAVRIVSDPAAGGGTALKFRSSPSRASVTIPTDTVGRVDVRVRGTACAGAPKANVSIDSTQVMSVEAPTTWTTKSAGVSVPAGTHTVTVAYPNNYYQSPSCNRDLFLDWVRVTTGSSTQTAPTTPTTPTPAPADGGTVIWAGDAEAGLASEWATGNAFDVNSGSATSTLYSTWNGSSRVQRVTSPVAQGSGAYAVTVRAGDADAYTSGAQRTEIGQNNGARSFTDGIDRQMYQGQDRWIGLQVRIPSNYPTATWNSLVQLKGAGTGNGPFGVYFENGRLSLHKSAAQGYGTTNMQFVWTSPETTVRDRWVKLLIHIKWSAWSDGAYELLGDLGDGQGFRQLKSLTPGWTLKYGSDGGPVSVGARFGIYRRAVAQDATAYFDGFAVATNRSDATMRAFGGSL